MTLVSCSICENKSPSNSNTTNFQLISTRQRVASLWPWQIIRHPTWQDDVSPRKKRELISLFYTGARRTSLNRHLTLLPLFRPAKERSTQIVVSSSLIFPSRTAQSFYCFTRSVCIDRSTSSIDDQDFLESMCPRRCSGALVSAFGRSFVAGMSVFQVFEKPLLRIEYDSTR